MCVIDKRSLIIKIVALKKVKIEIKSLQICITATVLFLSTRTKNNMYYWVRDFKHNDRQIILIKVNIIWQSISRCIQEAFTIHIYIK